MKILHTSDWHLGKKLDDFPRIDEQRIVMKEICEIAEQEQVDAVIVAGDLFDTFNPPAEATELFYKTLKKLSKDGQRPVIAIAGNHDSPDRIEAPDPLARECGIIFAGFPNSMVNTMELESGIKIVKRDEGFVELSLPQYDYPLRVLLTPYANEFRLRTFLGIDNSEEELRKILEESWQRICKEHCNDDGVNILVSHLFVNKRGVPLEEDLDEEKPIMLGGAQVIYTENIPQEMQYTALGHLHRMQAVDGNKMVYYCGSPISYSFSEANQKKYVLIVDVEPGQRAEVRQKELINVRPVLRKRVHGMNEAIEWLRANPEALVELTLVTKDYLTAEMRKTLSEEHSSIVQIIPEIENIEALKVKNDKDNLDLSKNIEELFIDYYRSVNKSEPAEDIMKLFNEVLAKNRN
ncbi:MAG: metallophosphoesterase family protein [Fermentimonas sp.]|jgi:exonuclease SbcD